MQKCSARMLTRTLRCTYYGAIAHAHTLIGRPGFASMATGLKFSETPYDMANDYDYHDFLFRVN